MVPPNGWQSVNHRRRRPRFRVVVASSLSVDVVPSHRRPVLVLYHSEDDKQPIGRCSLFGCHVAMGDMAPGLCVIMRMGGRG